MAVVAWRRTVPRPRGSWDDAVTPSLPHIVQEIVGGYVACLVIVLIFHVWIADDPAAFISTIGGTAFLCGILVVVASSGSLIRRRNRTKGEIRVRAPDIHAFTPSSSDVVPSSRDRHAVNPNAIIRSRRR
jgi:hypothetical protein